MIGSYRVVREWNVKYARNYATKSAKKPRQRYTGAAKCCGASGYCNRRVADNPARDHQRLTRGDTAGAACLAN
jgi:hypothetical protein